MTDDTHIYYDISIFNNDISGDMPVNLKFSEQRSGGALIENPQDYYLSIVRFEIDSPSLPIFIPQRRLGSSSFNDLIYIFGLEVIKGATNTPTARYKKRVQFIPVNPNISTDQLNAYVSANKEYSLSDEYYYIYNVKQWLRMVNTSLPHQQKEENEGKGHQKHQPFSGSREHFLDVERRGRLFIRENIHVCENMKAWFCWVFGVSSYRSSNGIFLKKILVVSPEPTFDLYQQILF